MKTLVALAVLIVVLTACASSPRGVKPEATPPVSPDTTKADTTAKW